MSPNCIKAHSQNSYSIASRFVKVLLGVRNEFGDALSRDFIGVILIPLCPTNHPEVVAGQKST